MPSITIEPPLPPLWKQRLCLDKLTSGPLVQWLEVPERGTHCVLQTDDSLLCVRIEEEGTSSVEGKAEIPPDDPILCFTAAFFDGEARAVTAHRSSLMRLWSGIRLEYVASFKAQHMGPVILLELSCKSGLLYSASSSGDSSIKVWSLGDQQCLQTFRPVTSRPTTLGVFSNASAEHICVGTVEGCVSVWKRGDDKAIHLRKHVSPIACLEFSQRFLLSGGRDQIIAVWDVDSWDCVKVIPVFENINAMRMLHQLSKAFCSKSTNDQVLVTGGQNGVLKIWNVSSKSELHAPSGMEKWTLPNVPVTGIHLSKDKLFFHQEDVIFSQKISTASKERPAALSLNENEVTDLVLVAQRFLIASTASHLLRSYDTSRFNALTVCYTPDEVTLTLAACKNGLSIFASAGRSKVVRIWRVMDDNELQSLADLSGHSASVRSIIMADHHVISADQDGVVKMWHLTDNFDKSSAICTKVCHEKEVTCLDLHLARGLVVSGSLDKEAKLWNINDMSQVASLRGHRRGIVCATFSTYDHVVATGSSDLVLKLWHTTTYVCLQTVEGLPGVPTKAIFMAKSSLVNTTANGHLSFWELNIKDQKVPLIFEAHSEQIWGLCVLGEELITGGKDGKIIFWKDNRQEVENEKAERKASAAKFEQMLANSISKGNVVKAVNLSLKLDKPHHAYKYLVQAHDEGNLITVLEGIFPKLLPRLVGYSRQWNTVSRQLVVAQHVQNFVLSRNLLTDESSSNLQGMLMFDHKHFSRLTALTNKLALVDNMLKHS